MKLFRTIIDSLLHAKPVRVATIIATSGSTPAPEQSQMVVVFDAGLQVHGTVGGGCLDENILWQIGHEPSDVPVRIATFDLNDDEGESGLMCGGTATIMQEALNAEMFPIYQRLYDLFTQGKTCVLATFWNGKGEYSKAVYNTDATFLFGSELDEIKNEMIQQVVHQCIASKKSIYSTDVSYQSVLQYLEPQPSVLIFGGGHVGKVVSQCAAIAGFRVTIIDDRLTYANRERFPEAAEIVCEGIDAAFQRLHIDNNYVVIVTRGHRYDELILEKIMSYDPKYVGMIGSKRKVAITFGNLKARGVSEVKLRLVHAPIGLKINANSVGEIGISIVAELIAVMRNAQK